MKFRFEFQIGIRNYLYNVNLSFKEFKFFSKVPNLCLEFYALIKIQNFELSVFFHFVCRLKFEMLAWIISKRYHHAQGYSTGIANDINFWEIYQDQNNGQTMTAKFINIVCTWVQYLIICLHSDHTISFTHYIRTMVLPLGLRVELSWVELS